MTKSADPRNGEGQDRDQRQQSGERVQPTDQASPSSRMASPAPLRFVSFISEYLRESRTPSAPARMASITTALVPSGVHLLDEAAVGISMSRPGQSCVREPST